MGLSPILPLAVNADSDDDDAAAPPVASARVEEGADADSRMLATVVWRAAALPDLTAPPSALFSAVALDDVLDDDDCGVDEIGAPTADEST